MQGIGYYQGWETSSYAISVSPEDVADLLIALKCLQKLTAYENTRTAKWRKLLESMNANDFGFERNATELYDRTTNIEMAG